MYGNAELIFCNVDNIHVMRASAIAFADALAMQQNMHATVKVHEIFVNYVVYSLVYCMYVCMYVCLYLSMYTCM